MEKKKLDRRVKYTKMVIKDSFVALLNVKPISKITIKEICEKADINRATFYSHYKDQYDLLHQIEEELFNDINQYLTGEYSTVSVESTNIMTKILLYIRKNSGICKVLLGKNGDVHFEKLIAELVEQQFIADWIEKKTITTEDVEYIYTFILNGCVGIIKKWLDSGMKKEENELAGLILNLSHQGSSAF